MFKRGLAAIAAAAIAVPIVIGALALPAAATTTLTVSNANDSGAGSLRQAMIDASQGGADENVNVAISIPASVGNIALTTGELQYDGGAGNSHSITITGSGQTISSSTSGGFDIAQTGGFTISDLKIAISGGAGDGIFSATHINGNNISVSGGDEGIIAEGTTMTLTDSQVTDSVRTGVEALGAITLVRTTVANNARYGIDTNDAGDATLTNSTVVNNATESSFVGINASNVVLKHSTVVGNGTTLNDHNILAVGDITSFGSVIAGQGHGHSCSFGGSVHTQGYNFSDDTSCDFTGTGDSQSVSNAALLGALANNGGASETRAPQTGSPLIDAIPTGSCAAGITTDQRGVTRPQGDGCDIGAVEIAVSTPPTTAPPGGGSPAPPASPVNAQPSLTG